MNFITFAFRVQRDSPLGWEDIAGFSFLHAAQIARDSFAPRPDTEHFKDIRFRVVNKEGVEQK